MFDDYLGKEIANQILFIFGVVQSIGCVYDHNIIHTFRSIYIDYIPKSVERKQNFPLAFWDICNFCRDVEPIWRELIVRVQRQCFIDWIQFYRSVHSINDIRAQWAFTCFNFLFISVFLFLFLSHLTIFLSLHRSLWILWTVCSICIHIQLVYEQSMWYSQ